jgi:hypothetical protein
MCQTRFLLNAANLQATHPSRFHCWFAHYLLCKKQSIAGYSAKPPVMMQNRQSLVQEMVHKQANCGFWRQNKDTMLGKLLLTIIVILVAIMVLRKRRQDERRELAIASTPTTASAAKPKDQQKPQLNDYRFAAYLFLALMLGTGSYLYYQRWQDDNSVVTVILHGDGANTPITYKVFKKDFDERSFTTVDDIRVTVASSERMEVSGL